MEAVAGGLGFSFSSAASNASPLHFRPCMTLLHPIGVQETLTSCKSSLHMCSALSSVVALAKLNSFEVFKFRSKTNPVSVQRCLTISASACVVEHVVLFKVKPETSADKVQALLDGVHGLRELDGVLELTFAPVLNLWPAHTSWAAGFTHVLHGRYKDKASLDAYLISPAHLSLVEDRVKPTVNDLFKDVLQLDWEASPSPPVDEDFGVIRTVLLKLIDGVTVEESKALLKILNSYPNIFPCVGQVSAGPNIKPVMAQGYNYAYWAQFKSVKELEELTANADYVALMETKVNPPVESFIIVDSLKESQAASVKL